MAAQRIAVVGGGLVGSAAAWRLSQAGHSVVLLEQFGPGHRRGASHGSSRIFRHAYANLHYIELARQALLGWRQLEDISGTTVLSLTGAVDHGDPQAIAPLGDALAAAGVEHELLDPAAAGRRWPGIRFDTVVLHHNSAGRLHADLAVEALQRQAVVAGAEIIHRSRVHAVLDGDRAAEVLTDDGVLRVDQVVVAAGAWTPELVGDQLELPYLRTTQEQPVHLTPLPGTGPWPSFIHHPGARLNGSGIYGLASADGVKIGEHGTGPLVHPDTRDFQPDPDGLDRLADYAQTWLPGVDPRSAAPISCLYTTTPDHHFLIDRRGRLTVAAGFSGHGFKFGPALGDLVTDLVSGSGRAHPLFALDRFRPAHRRSLAG